MALMPKMAYMFTWPALCGLSACLATRAMAGRWIRQMAHGLTVLAALVLFVPPILQGYLGSAFSQLPLLLGMASLTAGIIFQSHRLFLAEQA